MTIPFLLLAVADQRFRSADLRAAGYVLRLMAVVAVGTVAAVVWPKVSPRVSPTAHAEGTAAVLAVIAALCVAWLSLKLLGTGLLGGFLIGVALSQSAATRAAVERALGAVVPVVLVPVFLAAAGARVDPRAIDPSVIEGAAIFTVLLVAVAALAGWAGSRATRIGAGDARAITALVNCRGLVLPALAVEMADQHLIGPRLVAVFFLGAVGTTLMTGPLLARAARLARRAALQDGAQPPAWSQPATTARAPASPASPMSS